MLNACRIYHVTWYQQAVMKGQRAEVDWKDGVPVARAFDDPYFSLADGLSETRHVFLSGNDLPDRFKDGFHIAELGFGTGLNLLATIQLWILSEQQGRFRFSSFEAFPMSDADRTSALKVFPDLAAWADELSSNLSLGRLFRVGPADVEIVLGDVRDTLKIWQGNPDAWFLDGFSPNKNPEMWNSDILDSVGAHSPSGATFATYTAAGHVRRGLDAAGFEVERVPGFGRKRHMSRGVKR